MKNLKDSIKKVFLLLVIVAGLITPALAKQVTPNADSSDTKIAVQDEGEEHKKIEELKAQIDAAGIKANFTLNEHMEVIETDDGRKVLVGISEDEDVFYEYEEFMVDGELKVYPVTINKDEQESKDKELNELIASVQPRARSFSTFANISGASVVENYGFTHGSESSNIRNARNLFFIYAKKGETVRVVLSDKNRNQTSKTRDRTAYLIRQDSSLVKKQIMRPKDNAPVVETAVFEETSDKDQFYGFYTDDASNSNISYKATIQVGRNGGRHQKGRVFAENWAYYQLREQPAGRPYSMVGHSTTLYHLTPVGELYQQTFSDHNGLQFDIESNSVGIVEADDPYCEPVYSSTPNHRYSSKYEAMMRSSRCRNVVERNNLFLERPSADLPKESQLPGGFTKFVRPRIEDHIPSIENVSYRKREVDRHGGEIIFSTKNHEGNAQVIIEADNNGDGNFKEVRRYRPSIDRNKRITIRWDGRDALKRDVPTSSHINVRVVIDRVGEIHFVVDDLEMNRGGNKVTALENRSGVQSNVLHYDDSDQMKLPIDWSKTNPRFPGGFSRLNGFDSVNNSHYHAWDYNYAEGIDPAISTQAYRLKNYPGKQGVEGDHEESLGDGNYIHEWTWDKNYKGVTKEGRYGDLDLIYGYLGVTDDNKNDIVETGEGVSYKGSFYNVGTSPKDNPTILVDISDSRLDSTTVTNVKASLGGRNIMSSNRVYTSGGKTYLEISLRHKFDYNDKIDFSFDIDSKGVMNDGDPDILAQASIANGLGLTTPFMKDGLPATAFGSPSEKTKIKPGGANLSIRKSAEFKSDVANGDHIEYRILVANISKREAEDVLVYDGLKDPLLKNAVIKNVTTTGNRGIVSTSNGLRVRIPSLAANERFEIKFIAELKDVTQAAATINNTAELVYNNQELESSASVNVPANSVKVSKKMQDNGDKNGLMSAGEEIIIGFDIEATGARAVEELRIVDNLSDPKFKGLSNLKLIPGMSSKVAQDNSTAEKIDVSFGNIAAGTKAKAYFSATLSEDMVMDGSFINNTADYTSKNGGSGKVNAKIQTAKPEVKLTKSVEAGAVLGKYQTVHPSMKYKYVIKVENPSAALIKNLEVEDVFDETFFVDSLTKIDTSVANLSAGVKMGEIGDKKLIVKELPGGGSFDMIVELEMKDLDDISLYVNKSKNEIIDHTKEHLIKNRAYAKTKLVDGKRDVDVASVDKEGNDKTTVEVIFPILKQTKSVEHIDSGSGSNGDYTANETYKWQIKTSNVGKHRAENVIVKEVSQEFFDNVDIEKIMVNGVEVDKTLKNFEIPVLKPNETAYIDIYGSIIDVEHHKLPESIENIAEVEFADVKRESKADIEKGIADLEVTKKAKNQFAAAEANLSYDISVKNTGNVMLTDVKVLDKIEHPNIKGKEAELIQSVTLTLDGTNENLNAANFIKDGYLIEKLLPGQEAKFKLVFLMPEDLVATQASKIKNTAIVEVENIKKESIVETPVKEPELTIKKDGRFVSSTKDGEYLEYEILVENISDMDAKNVHIVDALDDKLFNDAKVEELVYTGGQDIKVESSKPLSVKVGRLAASDKVSIKFKVIPKNFNTTKVDNNAQVSYTDKKKESKKNIPIPANTIKVNKVMEDLGDNNGYVSPGEKVRFTFNIETNARRVLNDLRIIDELEDVKFENIKNLKVVEEKSAPIKLNNSTKDKVDVTFKPIAAGQKVKLVVEGEMSKGMKIDGKDLVNKAKYSSSNGPNGEVEANLPVAKPEVSLKKAVAANKPLSKYQTVSPSSEFKYTISVENTSKAIIYDLEVKDIFENNFFKKGVEIIDSKVVDASNGLKLASVAGDKVVVDELPAGGSFKFVLDVKMKDLKDIKLTQGGKELDPKEEHLLENIAKAETPKVDGIKHIDVESIDEEGNPKTTVEVIFPFLKQNKTVESSKGEKGFGALDEYKWTIETKNIGKYKMDNVIVKELSQDFFDYVDVNKILVDGKEVAAADRTFTFDSLAVNESKKVEIFGAIKDMKHMDLPETLTNKAGVEFADITRESSVSIKKGLAKMSVEKTTDNLYTAAGEIVSYQIKVKNDGDVLMQNILVKDDLSHPVIENAAASIRKVEKVRGETVTDLDAETFINEGYNIAKMNPQDEVVFNLDFVMPDNLRAEKAQSLDNSAKLIVENIEEDSFVSTPIKEAGIYATKSVSDDVELNDNIDGYAEAKEYLKYTIEVVNDSEVSAKNIQVIDELEDESLQKGELFNEEFEPMEQVDYRIDELAAGEKEVITFYVKLNEELPKEDRLIVNQADIHLSNGKSTATNKATIELIRPEVELIKDVTAIHPDNANDIDKAVSYRVLEYRFDVSNDSIVRVNKPMLKDEMLDENLQDAEVLRVYIAGGEELEGDIREGIELPALEPYSQITVYMDVKLGDINRGGENQDELAEFIENQASLESSNAERVTSTDSLGNEITKIAIGRYNVVGVTTVSDDIEGNIINDKVSPSDLIRHTIVFTNESDIALEDASLEDIFLDDKFKHFELEDAYGYTLDEEEEVTSNFEVIEDGKIAQSAEVGLVEPGHQVVMEVYHRAPEDLSVFARYDDDFLRLSSVLKANNVPETASTDVEGGPESIIEFEEVEKPAKVETFAKGASYLFASSLFISAAAVVLYERRRKRI